MSCVYMSPSTNNKGDIRTFWNDDLHLILKQGSKVKFNTWKRFPGHDFLQVELFLHSELMGAMVKAI